MKELSDWEFSSKYDTALLFILFPYKLMCTYFISGDVTVSFGCSMMKCDYYRAFSQNLYLGSVLLC